VNETHFMEVFCSNKKLVKNIFFVNALQNAFVNRVVKICLHVLKHQVNIPMIFCDEDLMELNNVLMKDFFENGDLSEGPLSIGSVLESFKYFFECVGLFVGFVHDFPYMTVGPRS
jgi:hypothetical protein